MCSANEQSRWRVPGQALRGCLLLHFAAADLQDVLGNTEAARKVYEGLVARLVPKEDGAAESRGVEVRAQRAGCQMYQVTLKASVGLGRHTAASSSSLKSVQRRDLATYASLLIHQKNVLELAWCAT